MIDMTNSFFQTRINPDHVHLIAINTPLGLYEWMAGYANGPKKSPCYPSMTCNCHITPTHWQIYHLYLDNIVIWSDTMNEHKHNVHAVLQALHDTHLYINLTKTHLFCTEINFLGHCISACGIKADTHKIFIIYTMGAL